MSDIITRSQYEELEQLHKQAKELQEQLDAICEKALAITEEGDEGGFTFDFIMNDFGSLKDLLTRLEIEVRD
jgi:DNA-binding protein YbaB